MQNISLKKYFANVVDIFLVRLQNIKNAPVSQAVDLDDWPSKYELYLHWEQVN